METERVVIEASLLAGKLMLQNGAETYRVEDTMIRIASASGMNNPQCFVTPTGIIFSIAGITQTHFIRIHSRGTDLEKIAKVNAVSRNLTDGKITIEETLEQLKRIEKEKSSYSIFTQIVAASLISGSFLLLFGGMWLDSFVAMVAGGAGFAILLAIEYVTKVKFFAEFFAAVTIALIGLLFVYVGMGHDIDLIIIASVMPLVPGLLITHAVRDLMAGHLFSGVTKGAEAMLTAFAIGSGVAIVLSLFL